jgi:hypothetical protein
MRKIDGKAKTIREILSGKRYALDYYQREYRWQRKQLQELIDDLSEQFLASYSSEDKREEVQIYGHYFLGSIILNHRDNETFIVDGQQRLTTLTLLLIMLHRRQGARTDRVKLEDLIYAERYGTRSFNIAVPERAVILEAMFQGDTSNVEDASESVQTIARCYQEIDELFPEEIDERALPFFCDWLIENVHLVEISATTDEDAYIIFETMNDRGLSLTPLDMLKGYLLSNIHDPSKRNEAAKTWRVRVEALRRLGKDEETDAVKSWLRAAYANSVRERHRGAENQDFERIGTEFHRWVDSNSEQIGLGGGDSYFRFVEQDMSFYTRQYQRLREASRKPVAGLESVFDVACFNFTLQYPLLLAPLRLDDSPELIDRKIRTVARFLDILLARRATNYLSMTYGAMSYAAFLIMKEIRRQDLDSLISILHRRLKEQDCDFNGTADESRRGLYAFGLNQWSKRYIKVLLARMTTYVEHASGDNTTSLATYLTGKTRFEIEHIWANHPERHADEFALPADFAEQRNRIGGLLLLPKSFNASYGDLPYSDPADPEGAKLPHYLTQNLLAESLHPQCYQHNPGFLRFVHESGLPFKAHAQFKKADLKDRSLLYLELAERIWNPDDLLREARHG